MGAQEVSSSEIRRVRSCLWKLLVKGSPCAVLPAKCPNQCWQPAPSLWDNKCLKDYVPDAELHGVSHSWSVWQPLQTSPHQWEAAYCSCLMQLFTLSFMSCVYIPHILTLEAEQIEHVNLSSLQPVIQFASTGLLPTPEGCCSMLTDWSSSVPIYISFFPSYTLSNL